MRVCEFPGCGAKHLALGLCRAHWTQKRRGPLHAILKTADQRFWAQVSKSDGCWTWTGALERGYGRFRGSSGKAVSSHRFSWELHNGPIPKGLYVCHHCDNPGCVRPDHLFLGTHQDNMRDMVAKGRSSRNKMTMAGVPRHVMTRDEIARLHSMAENGATYRAIAKTLGVSWHSVWSHRNGRRGGQRAKAA